MQFVEIVVGLVSFVLVILLYLFYIVLMTLLTLYITKRIGGLHRFHLQYHAVSNLLADFQNEQMMDIVGKANRKNLVSFLLFVGTAIVAFFGLVEGTLAFTIFIGTSAVMGLVYVFYFINKIYNIRVKLVHRDGLSPFGYETKTSSLDPHPRISQFDTAWYYYLFQVNASEIFVLSVVLLFFLATGSLAVPYSLYPGITAEFLVQIIVVIGVYTILISILPFLLIAKGNQNISNLISSIITGGLILTLQAGLDLIYPVLPVGGVLVLSLGLGFIQKRAEESPQKEDPLIKCPSCGEKTPRSSYDCSNCDEPIRCLSCGGYPWDKDWGYDTCPICGNVPNVVGRCLQCNFELRHMANDEMKD